MSSEDNINDRRQDDYEDNREQRPPNLKHGRGGNSPQRGGGGGGRGGGRHDTEDDYEDDREQNPSNLKHSRGGNNPQRERGEGGGRGGRRHDTEDDYEDDREQNPPNLKHSRGGNNPQRERGEGGGRGGRRHDTEDDYEDDREQNPPNLKHSRGGNNPQRERGEGGGRGGRRHDTEDDYEDDREQNPPNLKHSRGGNNPQRERGEGGGRGGRRHDTEDDYEDDREQRPPNLKHSRGGNNPQRGGGGGGRGGRRHDTEDNYEDERKQRPPNINNNVQRGGRGGGGRHDMDDNHEDNRKQRPHNVNNSRGGNTYQRGRGGAGGGGGRHDTGGRKHSSEGSDKMYAQARQESNGGRGGRGGSRGRGGENGGLGREYGCRGSEEKASSMPPRNAKQGVMGDYPDQLPMQSGPPRPLLDQPKSYQNPPQQYENQYYNQNQQEYGNSQQPPPQYVNQQPHHNSPPQFGNQQQYQNPPPLLRNQQQHYQNPPPQLGYSQQPYQNPPSQYVNQQPHHNSPQHYGNQQQYQNQQPQFGNQQQHQNPPSQLRNQQQHYQNPPPQFGNQQQPYQNPPQQYGNLQEPLQNQPQRNQQNQQQYQNVQRFQNPQQSYQIQQQPYQSHQLRSSGSNLTLNDDRNNQPPNRGRMPAGGKKSHSVMNISTLGQEEVPVRKSSNQRRGFNGEERNNPQSGKVPQNHHGARPKNSGNSHRKMDRSYSMQDVNRQPSNADENARPSSRRENCPPDRNMNHRNDRGGSERNVKGQRSDFDGRRRGKGGSNQRGNFRRDGERQSSCGKPQIWGDNESVASSDNSLSDEEDNDTDSYTMIQPQTFTGVRGRKLRGSDHRGTRATGKSCNSKEEILLSAEDDIAASEEDDTTRCQTEGFSEIPKRQESSGKQEEKDLEDIHEISLKTLKKRKKRYRKNISALKKEGGEEAQIQKMEKVLMILSKTLAYRQSSEAKADQSVNVDNEEMSNEEEETMTQETCWGLIYDETASTVDDDDDLDTDRRSSISVENKQSAKEWSNDNPKSKYRKKVEQFDTFSDKSSSSEKSSVNFKPSSTSKGLQPEKCFTMDENRKRTPSKCMPSEQEVFEFLVKHLNGQCSPTELKNNSGLFDKDFDIEEWLEQFHPTLRVIRRDGHIVSVIAFRKDITYCLDYIKKRPCNSNCGRYHICKDFLSGYCHFSGQCYFSHDFLDENNIEFSKKSRLFGSYTNEEILSIMRVRFPNLCKEWVRNSTCGVENCTALHMCRQFIFGRCTDDDGCPRCHDRDSPHNKSIAEALSMTSYSQAIFKNMVYVVRDQVPDNQGKSSRKGREFGADVTVKPRRIDSEDPPNICDKYLTGECTRPSCFNHHNTQGKLPYIWQIKPDVTWLNLGESENIEKAFCDLNTKSASFTLPGNADYKFCVRFEPYIHACVSMDYEGEREQQVEARRISTESYGKDNVVRQSFKTQWRWYYSDDNGCWQCFTSETTDSGVGTSDSMQLTLERKFLAEQTEYFFSRSENKNKYMYRLHFKDMKQDNLETGMSRDVWRRPVMVTQDMVSSKTFPPTLNITRNVETALPPLWAPWDLVQPFELVRLRENQTKYTSVSDRFHTSLNAQRYPICHIFRVQNHELWEMYQMKLKKMKEKLGPELDTRQLFHGTGGVNAVHGISTNNVDPKVSGKNATAYGQGAYFARNAKYSHAYTDPDPVTQKRYMFLVDVIVGEFTTGQKDYRRPPPKSGSTHLLYDACVDKMDNPSIFVVFDTNQFYPSYLVEYKCADDERALIGSAMAPSPSTRNSGTPSGSTVPASRSPVGFEAPEPVRCPERVKCPESVGSPDVAPAFSAAQRRPEPTQNQDNKCCIQ